MKKKPVKLIGLKRTIKAIKKLDRSAAKLVKKMKRT
jgi:hypothetical protein